MPVPARNTARTTISTLLLAGALAALSASTAQAQPAVTVRIDTPEFGVRIGQPLPRYAVPGVIVAPPVYGPPPVHYPAPFPPVVLAPPPIIYAPPPRVIYAPPPRVIYGPPAVVYPSPAYGPPYGVAYGQFRHHKHGRKHGKYKEHRAYRGGYGYDDD